MSDVEIGTGVPVAPHHRPSSHRRSSRLWRRLHVDRIRSAIPGLLGVAALATLILGLDPRVLGRALVAFDFRLVLPIVTVSVAYYVLQGIRWHLLLGDVGVRETLRNTMLLNFAGQSTALLPLGELTRAFLVVDATGADLGAVVATVTVQEGIYTVLLLLLAVPGLLAIGTATPAVATALLLMLLLFVSLGWCPAYRVLRAWVAATPLLRRLLPQVDELHNDVILLGHRPGTVVWSWLSLLGGACAVTVLWLIVHALYRAGITWEQAAYVFALSNVAGALSLIPGGIGAYEASVVGLLVSVGIPPGVAGAAAITHRLADKGLAMVLGFAAYGLARRQGLVHGLGNVRQALAEHHDETDRETAVCH